MQGNLNYFNRYRKKIWKKSTLISVKNDQQTKTRGEILQFDKRQVW